MKLVFLDTVTLGNVPNLNAFEKYGDYTSYEQTTPEQTVERCKGMDIVITNKVIFNKEVIEQLPDLKMIALTATGMNNIDLDFATEKGIVVKNAANYSTESVAQTTFSMVLQLVNRINYYDNYVKSGKYSRQSVFTHIAEGFWQLKGKNYGIIGLGNIGRRVAKIAEAFECNISYYSTSGKNSTSDYTRLELDELLRTSDIVSIHSPLNQNTRSLIGYNEICKMKSSAIIVNAGRGGIVVEKELAKALNENVIAGAATDVFEVEPTDQNNPLLNIKDPDKIILTPHIAWASIEARTLLVEISCKNIENFIV